MPHFFVPPQNISEGRFWIGPEGSNHLTRVLRKRVGDEVAIFDGADRAWRGVIDKVTPQRVEGKLLADDPSVPEAYAFRLFQGFPKGDKLDWILEKGTELGVTAFIPMDTDRAVGRLPPDRAKARLARWEKIVRVASQQCGRRRLPGVSAPVSLAEAMKKIGPGDWTFIPWESETGTPLKKALADFRRRAAGPPTINVMIGPEGGFAPAEVEKAKVAGAVPVTLGPRILRTETAGLYAASTILYELDL